MTDNEWQQSQLDAEGFYDPPPGYHEQHITLVFPHDERSRPTGVSLDKEGWRELLNNSPGPGQLSATAICIDACTYVITYDLDTKECISSRCVHKPA